jgi:hypothetical protein
LRWKNVCAEVEIVAGVVDEFEGEHVLDSARVDFTNAIDEGASATLCHACGLGKNPNGILAMLAMTD